MKLLFLTSPEQDILADSLLHGLRNLLGDHCIDFPQKQPLYRNYQPPAGFEPYGRLFTLWQTLEDIPIARDDVERQARAGDFDFVVVGSIHRSLDAFRRFASLVSRNSLVVLDGEDSRAVVVEGLRHPYYKRELDRFTALWFHDEVGRRRCFRPPLPTSLLGLRETSFSIPAEKIVKSPTPASRRTKLLPDHIVDEELRQSFGRSKGSARGYVHDSESSYYADLGTSLFGITTRRAGWDCLRHYELAANGTIICFKQLDQKPPRCAPHGLRNENSITYHDAHSFLKRICTLTVGECDALIEASHSWARASTTNRRGVEWLDSIRACVG